MMDGSMSLAYEEMMQLQRKQAEKRKELEQMLRDLYCPWLEGQEDMVSIDRIAKIAYLRDKIINREEYEILRNPGYSI